MTTPLIPRAQKAAIIAEADVPVELVFDSPHKPSLEALVIDLQRYRSIAMELGFYPLATSINTVVDQAKDLISILD